jgi:hypothetical protein
MPSGRRCGVSEPYYNPRRYITTPPRTGDPWKNYPESWMTRQFGAFTKPQLMRCTLADIQDYYRTGRISQELYEWYVDLWESSVTRLG